jgi:ribosome biogenesis GTPase
VRGDWERYEYYLKFLGEVIVKEDALYQVKDQESNMKLMTKASGESQYEPKLEIKKYRRTSRKEKQQNLQEFYQNQNSQLVDQELDDFED